MKKSLSMWTLAFCSVALLGVGMSSNVIAQQEDAITNSIMYAESFENYSHGFVFSHTNGWYSVDPVEGAVVKTNNYFYSLPRPFQPPHTQVLHIQAATTARFDMVSGAHNQIHLDFMLLPTFRDEETHPDIADDVQIAFYFNTNGQIVIYNGVWDAGTTSFVPTWTTITNAEHRIFADTWHRMTIVIDYATDTFDNINYFSIQFNNKPAITHSTAYNDRSFGSGTGGPWFVVPADWGDAGGNQNDFMREFIVQGSAFLDDMVITNTSILPIADWIIQATANAGGRIDPAGNVPVVSGSDVTFRITPDQFFRINTVRVDNVGIGGITDPYAMFEYTFSNVVTNHTLDVQFQAPLETLIVRSDWDGAMGIPTIPSTNQVPLGTLVDMVVTNSPTDFGDGSRQFCVGWTGIGSGLGTGVGSNFSFTFTGNTTVNWRWERQFRLNLTVDGNGTVNVNGLPYGRGTHQVWVRTNALVNLSAQPGGIDTFNGWTGVVTSTNTLASFTITAESNLTATFTDLATVIGPRGVPRTYFAEFGINVDTVYGGDLGAAELGDFDNDGQANWVEYYGGSNPNNPNSVFGILSMGFVGGNASITFYGSTNTGVTTPFNMLRGTNLLNVGAWTILPGTINRSATGTNVFTDTERPSGTIFYQPIFIRP